MRSNLCITALALVLVSTLALDAAACKKRRPPAKSDPTTDPTTDPKSNPASRTRRHVESVGGDPSTLRSRVVRSPDGGTVRVSVFQAKGLAPGALGALARDCQAGKYAQCTALGRAHQSAGKTAQAEKTWRVACKANHGPACFELGNMLSNPYLKLGRAPEAIPVLKKACKLKVGAACYFLGGFQEKGRLGLSKDAQAARAYYDRGCTHGHYWACKKVGRTPKPPKQP